MNNIEGYKVMIVDTNSEDDEKPGVVDKDCTDTVYVTLEGESKVKPFKRYQIQVPNQNWTGGAF